MLAESPPARTPTSQPDPLARTMNKERDVLVICAFVVLVGLLLQVTPAQDGVTAFGWRLPESCGYKILAGVDCPACGLTRSFVLGLRGDLDAFRLNPVGPLLLLTVLAQIPYRSLRLRRLAALRREGLVELEGVRSRRLWLAFRYFLIVALLVTWLIRI